MEGVGRVEGTGEARMEPLNAAELEALPLPRAERELAMAWLAQAEWFAALVFGATAALQKLIPARSVRAPRSSGLRPTA